jgi:hypothetical protein
MKKLIVMVFLMGCEDPCYTNMFKNITNYSVNPNTSTPSGIDVDSNGYWVDVEAIDRKVKEVEECLGTEISRSCLTVVIAPDWYISSCTGVALFPCDMPQSSCDEKNLPQVQTEDCPCACRSILQNFDAIITTPYLENFKGELARLVTGNNGVWYDENVNGCLGD